MTTHYTVHTVSKWLLFSPFCPEGAVVFDFAIALSL